uniref:RING-type domain-containing protein n=1 Tax=Sphaeramia orbicularis TaxID=375764 RepID=A0A672ZZU4_9TELE
MNSSLQRLGSHRSFQRPCAICFCSYDNIFKTPKLLACGHTFCLECLARINVSSVELKSLSCPVCREVTELRHGKDLPRLGNNQDIIDKLPPEMHRALSIRFKRSKGKLVLKSLPPTSPTSPTSPTTLNSLSLPVKNSQVTAGDDMRYTFILIFIMTSFLKYLSCFILSLSLIFLCV